MNHESSEQKTTASNLLTTPSPHPLWLIFDNKIAIYKPLYNKLGIILLIEPIDAETLAFANKIMCERGFFCQDMKIRFGTIQAIERAIPDSHVHFLKARNLLQKLQTIAACNQFVTHLVKKPEDVCVIYKQADPSTTWDLRLCYLIKIFKQSSISSQAALSIAKIIYNYLDKHYLQNNHLQQSTLHGIPFLPFTMRGDSFLADDSQEIIAIRIYPWISTRLHKTYQGTAFQKFAISLHLAGSSLKVRYMSNDDSQVLQDLHQAPEEVYADYLKGVKVAGDASLLRDAYAIPMHHTGIEVFFTEPCFFEEVQLADLKTKAKMMQALGNNLFEVICHVHDIDYMMIGANFFLQNKLSLGALNQLIRIVNQRKEKIIKQVHHLFSSLGIKISFMSPLENLFSSHLFKQCNVAQVILTKLSNRPIEEIVRDIYGRQEPTLIKLCVHALTNNKLNRQHAEIWKEIVTLTEQGCPELKRAFFSLPDFLNLSNAVAILIATKNMPQYALASIENVFDMQNQVLANHLLQLILVMEPSQQRFPSLVFITVFNQVLAYNLRQWKVSGNIFKYEDSTENTAYTLMQQKMYRPPSFPFPSSAHELLHKKKYSRFFSQQALINAACMEEGPGFIPLEHPAFPIASLSQSSE